MLGCEVPVERGKRVARGSFSGPAFQKPGFEALFANTNEQEVLLLMSCQNKRHDVFPPMLY